MLNKKLSLILLAAAAVVELTSLVWIRGEYRSTMIDGAEYQVPAAIDFKGDFYERNYLPVTVPLTEAPWHGEKAPEKGAEIYLTLTRNADGMMEITGAQDTRPGGDYLITRVLSYIDGMVHFHFPADRMYMSPEQLAKLSIVELSERVQVKNEQKKTTETHRKNELSALIHIKDGRAVIAKVLANGSPVEQTFTTIGKNINVQMLRRDRYFGEAGDIRQTDSACDPKGHRQHDEDRVRESRHPGCQVAVQKIIDPIDERYAGDQGERRCHHREKWIRRPGKIHRPIGRERRKESGNRNGDIPIHLQPVAGVFHERPHHRRQHGEERIDSMTAEDQAECCRCQPDREDDHPLGINAISKILPDIIQAKAEIIIGFVFIQCFPAGLTRLQKSRHIDAMAVAFAEHRICLFPIIDIDHDGRVCDMDLYIFPVDAKAGRCAEHVTHDTLAPCTTLHHQLPRIQDERHLASDGKRRIGYFHS